MDIGGEIATRWAAAMPGLPPGALGVAAVLAAIVVLVPGLWLRLRIAVTLVHELGHALVGVLSGRRFTGFGVRGDMSGHAVTVGPARGLGRIATTWAGYPMPALVGLLMLWSVSSGYAAALLSAGLLALVVALVFVRSVGTFVTVVAVGALVGALWWWRDDEVQGLVLATTGFVLLAGSWRHLAVVAFDGRRDRGSDPAVLSQLTGIPSILWTTTFLAVHAAATWAAALIVRDLLS